MAMDILKKWTPVIGTFLCAIVLTTFTRDRALTSRHLIWCAITIVLVFSTREIKIGKVHFFVLGWLFFSLFSGLYAINKAEWLNAVLRIVLVISYLSVVEIDKKLFSKAMIVLGLVFVAYFWYDYSKVPNFAHCRGLMMQRNTWAAAHFFIIPFCYYAIRERFWRKLSSLVIILMITNIILLASRSAMLALTVSVFTLMVLNRRLRPYILVSTVITIVLVSYFLGSRILEDDSIRTRLVQWKPTLTMIYKNPLGVGAGNWWIQFPNYAPNIDYRDAYLTESFRFPHNDFLWIWSESGHLGFIGYLGMFLFALYSAWKKKAIPWIIGILGCMAIAFFSCSYERVFPTLMAVTFISMSCDMKPVRQPRILITALVFAMVVFGFRFRAAYWNKKLRLADDKQDWSLVLDASYGGSVFSTLDHEGHPWQWWRGISNLKLGRYNMAVESLQIAYQQNPYNVQVLNGMGSVYGMYGEYGQSIKYFNEALRICPAYKEAQINREKVTILAEVYSVK